MVLELATVIDLPPHGQSGGLWSGVGLQQVESRVWGKGQREEGQGNFKHRTNNGLQVRQDTSIRGPFCRK